MRVLQTCEPSDSLVGHPMEHFAGEWVFELEVKSNQRLYLGPDVVGCARQWSGGALTAQGCWPTFGYDFESYSVFVTPQRQLTGGFFSKAGRSVADVVGVAVPQGLGFEPTLDLETAPPSCGQRWQLHRFVGPMLVATCWPSATKRQRLWTMHDAMSSTTVTFIEEANALAETEVQVDTTVVSAS